MAFGVPPRLRTRIRARRERRAALVTAPASAGGQGRAWSGLL
jgi:hypothetical protein